jgi:hypothetical protein
MWVGMISQPIVSLPSNAESLTGEVKQVDEYIMITHVHIKIKSFISTWNLSLKSQKSNNKPQKQYFEENKLEHFLWHPEGKLHTAGFGLF